MRVLNTFSVQDVRGLVDCMVGVNKCDGIGTGSPLPSRSEFLYSLSLYDLLKRLRSAECLVWMREILYEIAG